MIRFGFQQHQNSFFPLDFDNMPNHFERFRKKRTQLLMIEVYTF